MRNRLCALNLGNQAWLVFEFRASHIAKLACHFHVGGGLWKAHRHVIRLKTHSRANVFHVFGGERGRSQPAALLVDAFVIGQLAAQPHHGMHRLAFDRRDIQHDQAIVEQEHIALFNFARQLFVIQTHGMHIAQLGAVTIQHEGCAVFQKHLALRKLAHADLRALQIRHDRHHAARAARGLAHHMRPVNMVLRGAVAEIQADHAHLGANHGLEHFYSR